MVLSNVHVLVKPAIYNENLSLKKIEKTSLKLLTKPVILDGYNTMIPSYWGFVEQNKILVELLAKG